MSLAAGTRFGPYEIQAPLGAGGMGEVYRARDTRLDRTVAVKVLPEHLSADPQIRERFEREARTVSSLNHPHICALYDIGRQDGVDFLVMEYLEGETLAQRLAHKTAFTSKLLASGQPRPAAATEHLAQHEEATTKSPAPGAGLPVSEALAIAIDIADALATAHRVGITHRDLKPGNIMVTKAGAKLLDFGLAKQRPASAVFASGASVMPTEGAPLTIEGTILGTVQYMAPEQLEGKEADARTDVFAFGAVLFEMMTGRRAFEGKSHVSLIAAIIDHEPPPVSSLQPVSPLALDHLVKICLAKNPEKRWQSMADLLIHLRLIAESGAPVATPAVTVLTKRRPWIAWATAAASLVASLALAAVLMLGGESPDAARIVFDIMTPSNPAGNQIALSPDGRLLVAIVSNNGPSVLWVRRLEEPNPQVLAGTEGASFPFWSPDSRFIGYFANGKVKKVDVFGAPPQTLSDAGVGTGGTWSREGVIVFAPNLSGPLFRVSAAGGSSEAATALDRSRQETAHRHPSFLPDGQRFLYTAIGAKPEDSGIYVGSLGSRDRKRILSSALRATFSPPGYLLFMRENSLMAQKFDPTRLDLEGDPFAITERVGFNTTNSAVGLGVSDTGVLAFRAGGGTESRFLWFDRAGKQIGEAGVSAANQQSPVLSPDLQRVAFYKLDGPAGDIWTLDLVRGTTSRFTFDPAIDNAPLWSPDGASIVFQSNRAGLGDLYRKNSGGVGQEELLLKSDHLKTPDDWSLDGRFMLYRDQDAKTGSDLWVIPLTGDRPSAGSGRPELAAEGRKPQPVLQTPFNEMQGRFSPDGRWIAYVSDESGTNDVYVQSFPASGTKYQISTSGGYQPRWRRDGKELFFQSVSRDAMAAQVEISKDGAFQAGVPQKLFAFNPITQFSQRNSWDVTPDGQRFLVNGGSGATANAPLTVIVNWMKESK